MTITMVVLTGGVMLLTSLSAVNKLSDELTEELFQMKLAGDVNAMRYYTTYRYGYLELDSNTLVSQNGDPIEGETELVDQIYNELQVQASIFVRSGDDFVRIATSMRDESGHRAIGTRLGTENAATQATLRGEEYNGTARFYGANYYVAYDPIFDTNYRVIGVMMAAISTERAAYIVNDNLASMRWFIFWVLAGVLVVGGLVSVFFSNSIMMRVRKIILGLEAGSAQINEASTQLSNSSQQLSEATTEQAASLEETSSSMEEMASQVNQTSSNAQQAESSMKESLRLIELGVQAMQRMSKSMSVIENNAGQTSQIIKTIEEIAFQTNLLALNAAVEAARAGEAGKGFAVVADEVRNLAQRAGKAAQDTSVLIQQSQQSTSAGSVIASEVSENFSSIREASTQVGVLIAEIAAAAKEQSTGIGQINTALTQMDRVVQQNAAGSEETSSSAEELSAQASELQSIVQELVLIMEGGSSEAIQQSEKKSDFSAANKPVSRLIHIHTNGNASNMASQTNKNGKNKSIFRKEEKSDTSFDTVFENF